MLKETYGPNMQQPNIVVRKLNTSLPTTKSLITSSAKITTPN